MHLHTFPVYFYDTMQTTQADHNNMMHTDAYWHRDLKSFLHSARAGPHYSNIIMRKDETFWKKVNPEK